MQALVTSGKNILINGYSSMGRAADKKKEEGGTTIGVFNNLASRMVSFFVDLIQGKTFTFVFNNISYLWTCKGIISTGDDEWNKNQWGIGSNSYPCHMCKQHRTEFMDFTTGCKCKRTIGVVHLPELNRIESDSSA